MSVLPAESTRRLDSPLARRNPTVKLAVLFVVSGALLFVLDPVTPTVLYLAAVVAVVASARIPCRTLARAQLPFVGFAFGVFVVNVLSRPGEVLWQEGILRVTVEGIDIGAALAMRTLLTGFLSVAFVLSTDGVALMTSLHQQAGLSVRVTYAVLAGYRMLQQLGAEWSTIRHAQLVRAEYGRRGRPRRPVRRFGAAAFALLVGSLRQAERLSQSLESRGLGLSPRTTWRPVVLAWADAVFAAGILACLALVLATSAAAGVLEGPGGLF
ncbi:energy-coupling factor transporter transmembrane component T family protein [Mycetocola sp.]|uniref:energy-coupling factor transporter transmembrane component T family protein n=1 Tax=Mycetocola sp. TaxID=1871042 RepID=UPI003989349F